ncbi:MAG: ABC transporter permease subunit [Hyphomonadaceae bacterium]|nr:ABC transporter permease subunit [Hyphomonadaceae bacterium]
MFVQIVRRLLIAIPTMFVIIAAAFFLMRAAPGSPFSSERQVSAEIEQRMLAAYDLDKPVGEQFRLYVVRLLQGDLGPSMKYKDKDVADIIAEGLPTSLIIGGAAMLLALAVGSGLGVWAALRQNRPEDYVAMSFAVAGVCLPPLVLAPLFSLVFGVQLEWLPTSGLYRDHYTVSHLVLPVIALALPQVAIISRLIRASMIEAMRSNAIRTARAKGLPESQVVWRHALPVAMLPVVSYLGPAISAVLLGSFVIEKVFQLPGIGKLFTDGALQRDYTLVMGVVILYAGMIMFFNMMSDVLYSVLDPRARRS